MYARPGCHLCDEALALLLALGDAMDEKPIIEEVNILEDLALYARYRHSVPVISVKGDAGDQVLYAPITAPALCQALNIDQGCSDDARE